MSAPSQQLSWRRGFCEKTSSSSADCLLDDLGSFGLSRRAATDEHSARQACAARCHTCARCAYVSVSAAQRDCSWFAECDNYHGGSAQPAYRLPDDVPGFSTAYVKALDTAQPPPRPRDEELRTTCLSGLSARRKGPQRLLGLLRRQRTTLVQVGAHTGDFAFNASDGSGNSCSTPLPALTPSHSR